MITFVKVRILFEILSKMSQTFFIFAYNFKKAKVKLVIVVIALVGVAVMLLGVKIFFVKGGKFPNTHIHSNKHMKKRGITCAHDKEFYK